MTIDTIFLKIIINFMEKNMSKKLFKKIKKIYLKKEK